MSTADGRDARDRDDCRGPCAGKPAKFSRKALMASAGAVTPTAELPGNGAEYDMPGGFYCTSDFGT
jgi:hypothetical protein